MNYYANGKVEAFCEYKELFEKAVMFIIGLFNNPSFFTEKLENSSVIIKESLETKSEIRLVDGKYLIFLNANQNDLKANVLLQFAHELGHLLCMPLIKRKKNSRVKFENDSITTLTKRTGSVVYGIVFEEMFCNWLAYNVVSSIFPGELDNINISSEEIEIVSLIVNSFEILRLEKWDSRIDEEIPANTFLYGISKGDISDAVSTLEVFLGKGSWKNLMHSFYEYSTCTGLEKVEAMWKIKLILKSINKYVRSSFVTEAIA